jgi:hypothetical protein
MKQDDLRPMSKEAREFANKKNEEIAIERASRYHKVFVQNKDGAKILEEWMSLYVFGGFTDNDAGQTALAKAEARRELVSMIITQINMTQRS